MEFDSVSTIACSIFSTGEDLMELYSYHDSTFKTCMNVNGC